MAVPTRRDRVLRRPDGGAAESDPPAGVATPTPTPPVPAPLMAAPGDADAGGMEEMRIARVALVVALVLAIAMAAGLIAG
jgi:hypothetical protein